MKRTFQTKKTEKAKIQKVAYAQTWRTDLCLPRGRGLGEGWIESLGLTDANYYIENG